MALRVIAPGQHTTVQDLGRAGFRANGVPVGGAFDHVSLRLANALVGNLPGASVLEMTWTGGIFEALHPTALSLAGAPLTAILQRTTGAAAALRVPQSFTLEAGDRLSLGATARGARSYLAVREGFQTAPVLGSRSTESPIGAGAALPAAESRTHARWPCPSWLDELSLFEHTLRVVDGPDSSAQPFIGCLGEAYEVGALSNRVGLRLTANTLPAAPLDPDRLSRPVSPGAVQWTGKELIVLGPACGTMGGYPHIANVISPDIPRLAQFRPGDRVRIEHLTLERAWQADRQHRATIERLSLIIRTMGAK